MEMQGATKQAADQAANNYQIQMTAKRYFPKQHWEDTWLPTKMSKVSLRLFITLTLVFMVVAYLELSHWFIKSYYIPMIMILLIPYVIDDNIWKHRVSDTSYLWLLP